MLQFFGQFMKLPLEAIVYSMEMLAKTMRGLQHIASRGIDMVADGVVQPFVDTLGAQSHAITERTDGASGDSTEAAQYIPPKEERKMADRDLRDDQLKLVRYKILFVKRDYETVLLQDQEELVHDNITDSEYTGWKIAEFIQQLADHKTKVPEKWKNYPSYETTEDGRHKYRVGNTLLGLPEEDKKYLRVYYEVLDRYARERFRYEERQIEVLEDIRDRLDDRGRASDQRGGAGSGGGTGPDGDTESGGSSQPWRGR